MHTQLTSDKNIFDICIWQYSSCYNSKWFLLDNFNQSFVDRIKGFFYVCQFWRITQVMKPIRRLNTSYICEGTLAKVSRKWKIQHCKHPGLIKSSFIFKTIESLNFELEIMRLLTISLTRLSGCEWLLNNQLLVYKLEDVVYCVENAHTSY